MFALLMIVQQVGWYFLPSIGVLIFSCFLNYFTGKMYYKFMKVKMKAKDKRMETTNEIFNGIKIIKQNSWESFFLQKVLKRRVKEVHEIRKISDLWSFNIGFFYILPNLITFCVFALYVYYNSDLSTEQAFIIITVFLLIQDPLRSFPILV